jgi:hypothetical protein
MQAGTDARSVLFLHPVMQLVSSPLHRIGAAKDGWKQGRVMAARVATAAMIIRATCVDAGESLSRFMTPL